MGTRDHVREVAAGMLDIAEAAGSTQSGAVSPTFTIHGDQDGDGNLEEFDGETFEHAAILHRPADPGDGKGMELLVWRRGDEMVAIGSKDRRWMVELDAGEVILRAYGTSAAKIRLKPNGDIYLGDTASQMVARADRVETAINTLRTALATAATTAGEAPLAAAISGIANASGTACDKVRGI